MTLTIEVDGPHNENLSFRPLQRMIRGRIDFGRDSEPMAHSAAAGWSAIPGMRLGYDIDKKVGFVEESLHDDEHAPIREQIESKGLSIGPEREEHPDAHQATWLYWMAAAVTSGYARIVDGTLPTRLDESKVRKDFLLAQQPTETDRLTVATEKQNALLEALINKLGSSTT